ncbi:NAD(P)H-dependent glycerol-3-phosphate dehydrogenase [Enemella sp. A6]|uniref:NAD(P)H-dependent glycerol-3-phosphate dehydrogenase n=1 Tax=Enemella sp. A6 TaxID=3440152 RepID=UPI003EB9F1FA
MAFPTSGAWPANWPAPTWAENIGRGAAGDVAVLGAGSWGTTFSLVLADAGHRVRLWARRADVADEINHTHRNGAYLPGVDLPETITATTDVTEAVAGTSMVVLAVPAQALRAQLTTWLADGLDFGDSLILNLAKGIEEGTRARMTQVITEVTGVSPARIGVLTGPNLAREIAERQPAAAVIAAGSHDNAVAMQRACHTAWFRPYTNTDVVGCEVAGATKNVIALAIGMGQGVGAGHNAIAWLLTRGLAEVSRLGEAMGADPLTFAGLAGMGDLIATCSSPLSRNRTFGEHLGRGHSVDEAIRESRGVAEGVRTCGSVKALAEDYGVEMPIVQGVHTVLTEQVTPATMVEFAMGRALRSER